MPVVGGLIAATGAAQTAILNDLQAQGHALGHIAPEYLCPLIAGPQKSGAAMLVVGVGTGMNAAPVHETPWGRVVAASHRDLEALVRDGRFREDLYYRLQVFEIMLPPLRERREDVAMLTRYFLQRSAQQLGVEPKRMAEAALAQLCNFQFPGNVRQLENICHWLTVMAPAQVIESKDLPPEVLQSAEPAVALTAAAPVPAALSDVLAAGADVMVVAPLSPEPAAAVPSPWESALESEALQLLESGRTDVWDVLTRRFETRLIQAALFTTRGRRIEAAQKLGIGRNTITRKIQELGIEE
mgnify:CR=1 FL=1